MTRKPNKLIPDLEAFIWTGGLIALACTDPSAAGLVDACLFRWLGIEACPGCGLGHAVAYLFRGQFVASWHAHPLGGFAVVVLTGRIITLVRETYGIRSSDWEMREERKTILALPEGSNSTCQVNT